MKTMTYYKSVFMFVSFAVVSHVAYKYFTKNRKQIIQKEIHEVIMFSYGVGEIKKSKHSRCMITTSMDRLLYYLSQPRCNMDICMYVITNGDITNAIIKLHGRGIQIRIIIDTDMAFSYGSGMKKFSKHGIPVRWMKSTSLMHHKFCLIDTRSDDPNTTALLMVGSLNWTNQALCGNFEDCLITSQKELLQQYANEFERLWVLFKPIV